MKKSWWIVIGIIAIIIILGLIYFNNINNQDKTIKIGVIAPLTGSLSEYGIAFQNGILMAQDEMQNKNIQFIFEDSQYDPTKSVSAFYKLRDEDKVSLIVDWGASTCEADAALVKEKPMPFIAVTVDPKIISNSPYVIRANYAPKDLANKLYEYLREKNLKKIGIIKTNLFYLDKVYQGFLDGKKSDEKIELIDNFQTSDSDFRSSLLKIKKSDIEILGVFLIGGQINQFYKQAKENQLNITTFGTDFFESKPEVTASKGLMNGIVFANLEVSDSFRNKYDHKFKTESQIGFAGQGYDVSNILLTEVNYKNTEAIMDSIKLIKNFSGATGNISYKDSGLDRGFSFPIVLKIIKDGNFVEYEK